MFLYVLLFLCFTLLAYQVDVSSSRLQFGRGVQVPRLLGIPGAQLPVLGTEPLVNDSTDPQGPVSWRFGGSRSDSLKR